MLIAYDPILLKPGNINIQKKYGCNVPENLLKELFPETLDDTWLMTVYDCTEVQLQIASRKHKFSSPFINYIIPIK